MDKIKFLQVLVVVLLIINMITLAFAFGPKLIGPKDGIQQHFGFDVAQMEAFEKSRDEIVAQLNQLNPKLEDMSKAYYSQEKGVDGQAILEKIDLVNNDIYRAHLKHFQDLRQISTPEQQQKIPEFIERLMKNGGKKGPEKGPKQERG